MRLARWRIRAVRLASRQEGRRAAANGCGASKAPVTPAIGRGGAMPPAMPTRTPSRHRGDAVAGGTCAVRSKPTQSDYMANCKRQRLCDDMLVGLSCKLCVTVLGMLLVIQ